jgi:hypothetical protein
VQKKGSDPSSNLGGTTNMIDANQINIAIKIASEEYRSKKSFAVVRGIVGLLDAHSTMCKEILNLSENYLAKTITDPQVLYESLTLLRDHMKLEEDFVKKDLLEQYFTSSNQIN